MAIIGALSEKTTFEGGEHITLRTMTPEELAKFELERDKCRFGSGKFNNQKFNSLRRQVLKKLLRPVPGMTAADYPEPIGWGGFQRYDAATRTSPEWAYGDDQVDSFVDHPHTAKFLQQAFAKQIVASVKDEDKPGEEMPDTSDPVF